jgi:drug/metabolite transporter (DMT)-like permease
VIDPSWLWAVFTVLAAAGQTARNAMQRELTASLGTVGATHIRFLFGFPFALIFLLGVALFSGVALPHPSAIFWPWLLAGALCQIAATALMLAAMGERSFVVAIAYIKTEPIQVAIFGLLFLGDAISVPMMVAIVVATAGVVMMSFKSGMTGGNVSSKTGVNALMPTLIGLAAGGMFALSTIGYRGAILTVMPGSGFVMAATFTLTIGLLLQAALLTLYLAAFDRAVLAAIMKMWRPSLLAGFMGATASQFWFLAFALATAASVRTLALVEVLFAQAISSFIFGQKTSAREGIGIVMIVIGVVLLIWSHPT